MDTKIVILLYNKAMPKGSGPKQLKEENIAVLVMMAKEDIAKGMYRYYEVCDKGIEAEQNKIIRWITDRSPKWRSADSDAIKNEMRRLGLWEDATKLP